MGIYTCQGRPASSARMKALPRYLLKCHSFQDQKQSQCLAFLMNIHIDVEYTQILRCLLLKKTAMQHDLIYKLSYLASVTGIHSQIGLCIFQHMCSMYIYSRICYPTQNRPLDFTAPFHLTHGLIFSFPEETHLTCPKETEVAPVLLSALPTHKVS